MNNSLISNTNDFYHSNMWIENGILFGKYKTDIVIDLQVAKDIVNDRKTVSKGILRPCFIDVTEVLCIDTPGRRYLASSEACEFLSAGAIYSTNPLLRLVGNAFIILDRPLIPSKVFNNREQGIRWLEPFKNLN